jgi:hypothetical protein
VPLLLGAAAVATCGPEGDTGRAMSQENVEVVRRWLAVGSVGPQEVRAAVGEFCDADVDYPPVRKFFGRAALPRSGGVVRVARRLDGGVVSAGVVGSRADEVGWSAQVCAARVVAVGRGSRATSTSVFGCDTGASFE